MLLRQFIVFIHILSCLQVYARSEHEESDVIFKNSLVSILKPTAHDGIEVFTHGDNIKICQEGLKSLEKLKYENPSLYSDRVTLPNHSEYIYFRAPYTNRTVFDPNEVYDFKKGTYAIIKLNPSETYVMASEARYHFGGTRAINLRIPMLEYLKKIDAWAKEPQKYYQYNLLTWERRVGIFSKNNELRMDFDYDGFNHSKVWDDAPLETNSEIIVKKDHIPLSWLVACYHNGKEILNIHNTKSEL